MNIVEKLGLAVGSIFLAIVVVWRLGGLIRNAFSVFFSARQEIPAPPAISPPKRRR